MYVHPNQQLPQTNLQSIITCAIKQASFYCKGQYKYNLANGTDRQSESELQRQQLKIITELYRQGMKGFVGGDEMRLELICHYMIEIVDEYNEGQVNEEDRLKDIESVKLRSGYCSSKQLNRMVENSNIRLRNANIIGIKYGTVSVNKFVNHYHTVFNSFGNKKQKQGFIQQRKTDQFKKLYYQSLYGKYDMSLKAKRSSKLKILQDLDVCLQRKQNQKRQGNQQKNMKKKQLNLIESSQQNDVIMMSKQENKLNEGVIEKVKLQTEQIDNKQKTKKNRKKDKSKVKDSKKGQNSIKNDQIQGKLDLIQEADKAEQISNKKMNKEQTKVEKMKKKSQKKLQVKDQPMKIEKRSGLSVNNIRHLMNKKIQTSNASEQKQKQQQKESKKEYKQQVQVCANVNNENIKKNGVLNKIRKVESNSQKQSQSQKICQEDQQSIIQSLSISNNTFKNQKSHTFDNSLRESKVEHGQNDKNLDKKKQKAKTSFKNATPTNNTTLDNFIKKK